MLMNFPRVSRYASDTKSFLRSVWQRRRTSPQKRSIAFRWEERGGGVKFLCLDKRRALELQVTHLEVHEVHQLGDFWLQDLHRLLIDLHSVGLLVAFHLRT